MEALSTRHQNLLGFVNQATRLLQSAQHLCSSMACSLDIFSLCQIHQLRFKVLVLGHLQDFGIKRLFLRCLRLCFALCFALRIPLGFWGWFRNLFFRFLFLLFSLLCWRLFLWFLFFFGRFFLIGILVFTLWITSFSCR